MKIVCRSIPNRNGDIFNFHVGPFLLDLIKVIYFTSIAPDLYRFVSPLTTSLSTARAPESTSPHALERTQINPLALFREHVSNILLRRSRVGQNKRVYNPPYSCRYFLPILYGGSFLFLFLKTSVAFLVNIIGSKGNVKTQKWKNGI